jgi:4-hydroxythreonine-4-phosphate dehydrogenase
MKLAVTIGDPAGIGPEITLAAVAALPLARQRQLIVFGDQGPLRQAAARAAVTLPALRYVGEGYGDAVVLGQPDASAGRAAVSYLEAAVRALRDGEAAGLVTAPISKTWARRAGFAFPGHTEFLAERLGSRAVAMMFAGLRLQVALVTVHVPLAEVARELTAGRVRDVIDLLVDALRRDCGIPRPRVGVVGLNPHAGEGGLLGREEIEILEPAIADARRHHGADCELLGPLVPDAAFRQAAEGGYHGLVAMYHDQALIPVKLLEFEDAVNVTLGLPVVRTSPDHGTAYDIAGQGRARSRSMQRALQLAFEMVERRTSKLRDAPSGA